MSEYIHEYLIKELEELDWETTEDLLPVLTESRKSHFFKHLMGHGVLEKDPETGKVVVKHNVHKQDYIDHLKIKRRDYRKKRLEKLIAHGKTVKGHHTKELRAKGFDVSAIE
jgi:hypothetical protein